MRSDLLIIAHTYGPGHNRVLMELDVAAEAGLRAELICLRAEGEPARDEYRTTRIHRLPIKRHRGAPFLVYLLEYIGFMVGATLLAGWLSIRSRPRWVIVHSLPDVLVFSAVIPKLLGSRVIANLREFTPELVCTRYGVADDHWLVRVTRSMEAASCAFADRVVTVHDPGIDLLASRGVPRSKLVPIVNTIKREMGNAADRGSTGRPFTLLYHGTAGNEYDLNTVIEALSILHGRGLTPSMVRFRVVADGASIPLAREAVTRLGLQEFVSFEERIPYDRVPELLADADVGVAILTETIYAHVGLPTKLLECVAAGIPVITVPGRVIQSYFPDDTVRYVPFADAAALAEAIDELRVRPEERAHRIERATLSLRPLLPQEMKRRYRRMLDLEPPLFAGEGRPDSGRLRTSPAGLAS